MIDFRILQKMSFLLLFTLILSFFHKVKHGIFYFLQIILGILFITSSLFWNNPIRNSGIHRMDAFIVRIAITLCILYTFMYNIPESFFLYIYFIILGLFILSFLGSNHYSEIEWCCENHILYHSLLHYYGWIIGLFAIA
jgi:hypothetical protein